MTARLQRPVPIGNFVLIENIDLTVQLFVSWFHSMWIVLSLLFSSLGSFLRSRVALQAEILALRHQLLVLEVPSVVDALDCRMLIASSGCGCPASSKVVVPLSA